MALNSPKNNNIPPTVLEYFDLTAIPEKRPIETQGGKIEDSGVIGLVLYGDLSSWKYYANRGDLPRNKKYFELLADIFTYTLYDNGTGSMSEGIERIVYEWVTKKLQLEKIKIASDPVNTLVGTIQ